MFENYANHTPTIRLDPRIVILRLGSLLANAFSKAVFRHACTGPVVAWGGFRRVSKAEYSRPTENGGGESRDWRDGINSATR